jgi:hypothetical protein
VPGKPVSYGFGSFLEFHPGPPRMWHSGTNIHMTLVIPCNRADFDPAVLAFEIFNLYQGSGK